MQLSTAANHMTTLCTQLGERYQERGPVINALALSAIAGTHVLLLGPPGTAKSAITVDFSEALGLNSFTRLLGKTSTPDEIFGPFSLSGLRDDRYEREIEGYMPTAEVAFVDEIFKANSAVLNSMLTILNERVFDQGSKRIPVPLRFCVGASNEMPEQGLDALFDRFLTRIKVDYIRSGNAFDALLAGESIPVEISPLPEGTLEALQTAAAAVDLTGILPVLRQLWEELLNQEIIVSDRRFRSSLALIRASAALAGRSVATPADLRVLSSVLWSDPEDEGSIRAIVSRMRSKHLNKIIDLHGAISEKVAGLGTLTELSTAKIDQAGHVARVIDNSLAEAAKSRDELDQADLEEADHLISDIESMRGALAAQISRCLGGVNLD